MIQSSRASLIVTSRKTSPETVTELLAIKPNKVLRKGTALRSGRTQGHNVWSIDTETTATTDTDQTGSGALRELLDRCRPAVGTLRHLPADCEARIWWSGDSDSAQGGFVLPTDVIGQIAQLGVDLYGTVYLDDVEATERREQTAR